MFQQVLLNIKNKIKKNNRCTISAVKESTNN